MSAKLKPCPFCGCLASLGKHGMWIGAVFYNEVFTGECTKCGAKSRTWTCCEDATRAWNFRPIEDTQATRIAELERAIELALSFCAIQTEHKKIADILCATGVDLGQVGVSGQGEKK